MKKAVFIAEKPSVAAEIQQEKMAIWKAIMQ